MFKRIYSVDDLIGFRATRASKLGRIYNIIMKLANIMTKCLSKFEFCILMQEYFIKKPLNINRILLLIYVSTGALNS